MKAGDHIGIVAALVTVNIDRYYSYIFKSHLFQ